MASSSPISCLQCRKSDSSSDHFKNGWRLRSGDFAQLCPRCAHVYDEGKFCETFHSNDDGWRDCDSCGKLVHCGCVVSFNAYMLLDYGGILCIECSRMNFIVARNRCMAPEKQLLTGESQCHQMRHSLIVPQASSPNKKLSPEYSELVETPSFETVLSSSDTDLNYFQLIIPNKCAEAFFPVISDPKGIPILINDTSGKVWEFKYRYLITGSDKIYVLEALREFMIDKNWQIGDTVIVHRMDPGAGGTLLISSDYEKASICTSTICWNSIKESTALLLA